MVRQILITGEGKGKSFFAQLLAENYRKAGTEVQVVHVGSKEEAARIIPPLSGYLVVVSNCMAIDSPWQMIVVSGGQSSLDAL